MTHMGDKFALGATRLLGGIPRFEAFLNRCFQRFIRGRKLCSLRFQAVSFVLDLPVVAGDPVQHAIETIEKTTDFVIVKFAGTNRVVTLAHPTRNSEEFLQGAYDQVL